MTTPTPPPEVNEPLPATPRRLALSLGAGAVGGALFFVLALPLPWMLGAMAATAALAIAGKPITMSRHMRQLMIAVIGVLLGSAFNPAMVNQVAQWAASLSVLAVFLAVLALIVPWIFRRGGYDRVTAYFSALPAGLTEMTAVGMDNGGNAQTIALTHTVRVLMVAFIVPFIIVFGLGYDRPAGTGSAVADMSGTDVAWLAGCAIVGLWAGTKFRMPAGALAGPLILSAAVHLAGLTASSPPNSLVAVAQVVLGTSVGARFAGLTLARSRKTVALSAIVTLGMLAVSAATAFLIGPLIGIAPMALLLALSPGGVTEMSLMALALNQDIAFVTTHHVARIALIVMIGPAVFAAYMRLQNGLKNTTSSGNQE